MFTPKWIDFSPKLCEVFRSYSLKRFWSDAMSGIIVGIVALPLAIAFGIASGVSPEVGIFTAILGGFVVSVLGGSNVQIGGPTGAFIVVVYGIIERYGIDGLIVATLMAGLLLVVMGFLRLGSLIKFIPYPIIVGFTAGIALTIFSTQINDLLGLGLTALPGDFLGKWSTYLAALHNISLWSVLFGVLTILLIVIAPRILSKRIPGSLLAIVLLSILSFLLKHFFDISGLECIGDRYTISDALPSPHFPNISLSSIRELFPSAFTIALLGAIESLLSASVADGVTGDRHRSNTELIAQGAANLLVPLFGGIPVTGAIARTMTNIHNGGRTPIAGILHAFVLLLILLFLAPLMDYIPMSVLAGVLVIVSYNMSGWRSIVGIFRGPRSDIAVMLVTFALTVLLDLTVAIEIGLLLAMLTFMRRMIESVRIRVSEDRLLLDREEQAEQRQGEESIAIPQGVEVYEIEGPFFFGIANRFAETITGLGHDSQIRIVRMRFVSFMDSTGLHNLENLLRICRMNKIHLILSGVNRDVLHTLHSSGLLYEFGVENVLPNIHLALRRANDLLKTTTSVGAPS